MNKKVEYLFNNILIIGNVVLLHLKLICIYLFMYDTWIYSFIWQINQIY